MLSHGRGCFERAEKDQVPHGPQHALVGTLLGGRVVRLDTPFVRKLVRRIHLEGLIIGLQMRHYATSFPRLFFRLPDNSCNTTYAPGSYLDDFPNLS